MLTPRCMAKLITLGLLLIAPASAVVLAESESCAVRNDAGVEAKVTFDVTGRLSAAPPRCLFDNDSVVFQVADDPVFREQLVVQDLKGYIDALAGLAALEKEVLANSALEFKLWGLSLRGAASDVAQVRDEICQRARHLAARLTTGQAVFDARLNELGCAAAAAAVPPPNFVPAEEAVEYSVRLRCFGPEGTLRSVTGPKPITPANPANGFLESTKLSMSMDCAKVQYELRRTDPLVARAKKWADSQPASLELRRLIEAGRDELAKEPRPQEVAKKYKDLADCLKTALAPVLRGNATDPIRARALAASQLCRLPDGTTLSQASEEIAGALDRVNSIVADVTRQVAANGWVKRWLWLTKGVPRLNPFLFLSERARLEAQVKKDTETLAELEAQVATFELIASNKGLDLPTLSNLPAELKPLAEARQNRDRLRKSLEQARQQLADLGEGSDADDLLYRGELYLSDAQRRFSMRRDGPHFAVMQHHDAQNEYLVMAPLTVQEIRETERLYILAENEKEDTKLKAAVTVARISPDTSGTSAEAALSRTGAALNNMVATDPLTEFVTLFNNYNSLVVRLSFLEEQLDLPPLLFSPTEDKSPVLVTKLVPHEVPSNAPAQVAYVINKKVGDQNQEAWKGEYRVNKLYRLRLKAGLVYSDLETSDFTLADNGSVKEQRDRHGVDGTFGVQIYPFGRRDIRNPTRGEKLLPVLFTGFSMKSPKDDIYVGAGWEPWPGVTFLYGRDYGRGEKVVTAQDGSKQVRSRWDHDSFYSVLIDVDFFRQLFGLKGIL